MCFEMTIVAVVIGQHSYPPSPESLGSTGNGSRRSDDVGHAAKLSYE